MFYGSSNVQLDGRLLKVHYPKLTVMRRVEHSVSLFFNDFSKIPIVHQIISAHKMIYNIFDSGIYHRPHYILNRNIKSFRIKDIVLFRGNDTRMAGYFIGMHRELWVKKFFNQPYRLQNSSVYLPINVLTDQLGIFMIISCGKGDMYFSRLCSLSKSSLIGR